VITESALHRRRTAALAGHRGDTATLLALCHDPDPSVRSTALGGLERCRCLDDDELRRALLDPAPAVRRRAAELAAGQRDVSLLATLLDRDPLVVEMAAWAAGERADDPELDVVVARLVELAGAHRDPLVREAAVAALGSLEAPAGRPAVLAAMHDKPNVRRRAVLALVVHDGPDIDAALEAATKDRDWQVRDAAEELLRLGEPDEPH
jgi:HEAT repeat protein